MVHGISEISSNSWLYLVFSAVVLVMLALDLGLFNRKPHSIGLKEAGIWTLVWIGLAMGFSALIYAWTYQTHGIEKWTQFQTAYWIEKALSMDNLFVFMLIFNHFKVPPQLQHKVLFWGVIGALFMRALFIYAGVGLVQISYVSIASPFPGLVNHPLEFNIILFVFGLFLFVAGIKSFWSAAEQGSEFSGQKWLNRISKWLPLGGDIQSGKFFIRQEKLIFTPLFIVLLAVEFTDLIFAVDSVPAIFSVAPDDPFILYTSNIFAILGLRSLYFVLDGFANAFSYLKKGLGLILVFIGAKMLIAPILHIPALVSLGILGGILLCSVLISIVKKKELKG